MQSQRIDETQRCEQCGAPLQTRAEIGCLYCLLQGGMDGSGGEARVSSPDFGTRRYQHYEILTHPDGSAWELGRGAMGVTYNAVDVNLQMPVALKVVNGRFSSQPGSNRRFLQEAQAAARLRHPNVASVFHFGIVNALPGSGSVMTAGGDDVEEGGDCFYAMEFVEGETLEARLRRGGPLGPVMAIKLGLQVARAMVAAEKRGLIHRDLKPSNIMLLTEEDAEAGDELRAATGEAWVKVIDFGLAQVATEEMGTSTSSLFLGTLAFASPEQIEGRPLDVRSDIYSLGVTLWYSLTGELPFPSSTNAKSPNKKPHLALPVAQLLKRRTPEPLVGLLELLLATDPGRRPASAIALYDALNDCLESISQVPATADRFFRGSRKRVTLAVVGVACILLGLAGYLSWPGSPPDDKSIAVLPFKNLGDDPGNAFFAEGIEDDLRSSLIKIRDLKVIGRQSASRYRPDSARDLPAIGRTLGTRHVLEGSLQRTGNHVLLRVALLDTRDGHELWAERYDRTLADAITLQGELAAAIVEALDATLSPQERVVIRSKPTGNPDAYLLYLRGRKFENRRASAISDYEAAATLYSQALAVDPGFAQAHARLAGRLSLLYRFRGPSEELKARAYAEAREALRLRPDLGEAYLAEGLCLYQIDRDFHRALPKFETALRLLPNDPEPESYIAFIHRRQGRWREAWAGLERVASRDPRTMLYQEELFATASLLRDWLSAANHADRITTLEPGLPQVKIERAYLDIWRRGDLSPIRKVFADYTAYGDPEGDVAWARWDSAMIARDFIGAEAAINSFPFETLPSVFSAPLPKSYLEACIALAQDDKPHAQELFEIARPPMEAETLAHPHDALRHARLGLLYAYMGRKTDAIREGEYAVQLQPASLDAYDGPERLCNLALIHARVGDVDQALSMIESLLRKPGCVSFYEASMSLAELRLRWQWDPLRADPRFQKILAGPEPVTVY